MVGSNSEGLLQACISSNITCIDMFSLGKFIILLLCRLLGQNFRLVQVDKINIGLGNICASLGNQTEKLTKPTP